MSNQVILKQKNVVIEHDKENNVLICDWIGFQTVDSIKATGEKILEIFSKIDCAKVLNDNTQVTGPWQGAAEWVSTVWFPGMEKVGMKKFAWIFSENVFAQMSAQKALPPNTNVVKIFNGRKPAWDWLTEK